MLDTFRSDLTAHDVTHEIPTIGVTETIPATAKIFRCSTGFIYELVKQKKLDLIKPGPKCSRITGASIVRQLNQRAKPDIGLPNLKQFTKAKSSARSA